MLEIRKTKVKIEQELTIIDNDEQDVVNDEVIRMQPRVSTFHSIRQNEAENYDEKGCKQNDVKCSIVRLKQEPELEIFDVHENVPVIFDANHPRVVLGDILKSNISIDNIFTPNASKLPSVQSFPQKDTDESTTCASQFPQIGEHPDIIEVESNRCNKTFLSHRSQVQHFKTHERVRGQTFQCYNCRETFSASKECRQHSLKCLNYGKTSRHRHESRQHLLRHVGEKLVDTAPNRDTQETGKRFVIVKLVDGLKVDGKSHTFECYICKRIFSADSLPKHFTEAQLSERDSKNQVDQKRRFPCEYPNCNRTYLRKIYLAQHMLNHTDERNHVCAFANCDRKFLMAKALYMHKRIHTNERKYVCSHGGCGKRFKTRAYLTKHEYTHAARRYVCEFENCGKRFIKKSKLTRHYISHMTARLVSCTHLQCDKKFKDTRKK